MSDGYSLSPRKARICRLGGGFFLFAAALTAIIVPFSAAWPEFAAFCRTEYCEISEGPLDALPNDVQAQVRASASAQAAFDAYLARPIVRLGAMGVAATTALPFALMLLGVGIALRKLGRRGGQAVDAALPWLRRASIAAIIWAIAEPLSSSLNIMLVYPGTPAGPHWHFVLDIIAIGKGLMLGLAAYATVWALESGLRAQRDLDEFV